jgi:hypothetical protein
VGAAGDVIYVDDVRLDGAEPASVTPTATGTAEPTITPPPGATSTHAPAATKTAAPTKTVAPTNTPRPTATPNAAAIAPVSGGLTNAGFESTSEGGLPTAWQKYGGVLRGVDTHVRSGGRAAQLESTSTSTKWLFQSVLVDGGGFYEFGAWIDNDDPGVAAAFLRVSWYASEDARGIALDAADSTERLTSPASEYRHLTTGSITAPADAHSARLRIMLAPVSAAPAAIFADDASFRTADPVDAAVAPPAAAPAAAAPANGGESSEDEAAPPVRRVLGKSTSPRAAQSGAAATSGIASTSHVVINEVMYDPNGAVDPAAAEWVELYNAGDAPVSLADWSLADAASTDTLSSGSIEPHGYLIIAASDSFRTNDPGFTGATVALDGRIGNSLGNDGDRLVLRDASGATADAVSWGTDSSILKPAIVDAPSGHSIERRTAGVDRDLASDFIDNMHPSPGREFVPTNAQLPTRQSAGQPQKLPSGQQAMDRVLWAVAALAGAALAAVVAWRVAPALSERIRRQA